MQMQMQMQMQMRMQMRMHFNCTTIESWKLNPESWILEAESGKRKAARLQTMEYLKPLEIRPSRGLDTLPYLEE